MKKTLLSLTVATLWVGLPTSSCGQSVLSSPGTSSSHPAETHSPVRTVVTPAVVHAHRGGAAEYPENTLEAMLHAVSIGVPVLEMDLHVTRDHQVVLSHDPYLQRSKFLKPDGSEIQATEQDQYAIYALPYDSLKSFDAGSRFNPQYPLRRQLRCHIPRVGELIDSVEAYTARHGLQPVSYNIEIKSWPDKDGLYTPDYRTFTDLCMEVLLSKQLGDRLIMQCFDARTLNYLHERYPQVTLSYLIESEAGVDLESQLRRLTFTPPILSPDHHLVDEAWMQQARQKDFQIIPWTVDDPEEVQRLAKLGVDALITNRPTAVREWLGQ